MTSARFGVVTMVLIAAGCGKRVAEPGVTATAKPPGLYAEPTQLAFTCVNLGCDERKIVRLTVVGERRVAVKRLLLTGPAATDFSFTASTNAPFIMGSGASFDVTIRYAPRGAPAPGSVVLVATYTDASPDESEDRLPPGEVPIPLVRRLVGEPELIVTPTALHYGVVLMGAEKTFELRLSNGGFGNVALDVSAIDAGTTGIQVTLPALRSMVADSGIVVPMTWRPTTAEYLRAQLEIAVSTPGASGGAVLVDGTSLSFARMAIAPTVSLDFGEVPRGQSRRLPIEVVNQGGSPLVVSRVALIDSLQSIRVLSSDGGVLAVDGGASFTVAPLEREPLVLELRGAMAGELEGRLLLTSNDAAVAVTAVELRGTVTEPKIQVTPTASLDFGTVPQGWVVTKPIELRNVGFGSLTVKNISFVAGSSTLYSFVNQPVLPVQLRRDQRVALQLQFRAETAASFNASVSIETDEANHSFAELPATARVGTCDEGCPIANGLPNCTAGVCSVESCNVNWYDTDQAAANGCECHDLDTDPGEFCADAADIGTLRDKDKVQRSFTGLLAAPNDIDVLRFFAEDNSGFFDEDYNVKIRLESNDPSIKLCIYRHDNENHSGECYFDNEECPQNRTYERDGTLGREDGADFIMKISRIDGVGPVCTTYTVFMSNGL